MLKVVTLTNTVVLKRIKIYYGVIYMHERASFCCFFARQDRCSIEKAFEILVPLEVESHGYQNSLAIAISIS